MKKEYFSPQITEISALKDTYCDSETISSFIENGFSDNAGTQLEDTDFD